MRATDCAKTDDLSGCLLFAFASLLARRNVATSDEPLRTGSYVEDTPQILREAFEGAFAYIPCYTETCLSTCVRP